MKRKGFRWKILIPLVLGILIMAVAFVAISYYTYRDSVIEDSVRYSRGLTGLIARDLVKANDVEGILRMEKLFPAIGRS